MAVEFAKLTPDETFSVAELQGYLLNRKLDPKGAVDNISTWVKEQEEERARIEQAKLERRLQVAQEMKEVDDRRFTVPEESATEIKSKENVVVIDNLDADSLSSSSMVESATGDMEIVG